MNVVQTDVHVSLNATAANISDDDFVQPVARHVNPVSSSSDKSVKKMEKQLKRLEAVWVDDDTVIKILLMKIMTLVPVDNDAGAKDTPAEKIDIPVDGVNAQNEVSDNEVFEQVVEKLMVLFLRNVIRFSEAKVNPGAPISYVDGVNVAGEVVNDVEAVDKNGSKSEQVAKNIDSSVAELSVVADEAKEDVVSVISHVPGAEVEVATLCNILSRSELSVVEHDNIDDKILEVAREALHNAICDEGMDDLASCFNKSSHDDMKDAGVYGTVTSQ
ncbi:hypothetical protein AgCh_004280 [Apium graveolens]